MIRFLLLLFLSISIWLPAQAQSIYRTGDPVEFYTANQSAQGPKKKIVAADVAGSPYIREDFQKGEVVTYKDIVYPDIPFRYNIYNDKMEFKTSENQILTIANPELIRFIELEDHTWTYRPYFKGRKLENGFFVLLEEDKVSLLLKKNMILQKAKSPGAYREAEPAQFVAKPDDFFIQPKGKAAQIIINKKDLPALFPDKQKELAAFIKKNKTKTTKLEDLIELVQYYHSL